MASKQRNITANFARQLLFFEGENVAYNYKTSQWSEVPAYDATGMYTIRDKDADIGLVIYSTGSVDLQKQLMTDVAQTAIFATGDQDLNQFGRAVAKGVKPLTNGGTATVEVGTRADLSDSVTWSTSTSINSRTQYANFRVESRYHRVRITLSGGFNTFYGADVEWEPTGKV